jgi:hypothetical protein
VHCLTPAIAAELRRGAIVARATMLDRGREK